MGSFFERYRDSPMIMKQEIWKNRGHFVNFFGVTGVIAGVLVTIFLPESIYIVSGEALLLVLYPTIVGAKATWERLKQRGPIEDFPKLPKQEYFAIAYSDSSDQDLLELSKFSTEFFGDDTVPADVLLQAVHNGSVLGLRLTTEDRKHNVGFLDVIHFRDDILKKWISGDESEEQLQPDQFEQIDLVKPSAPHLKLAIGALCVKHATIAADFHRTAAFVNAGIEYLKRKCARYEEVTLYATIFNEAGGKRWAEETGFTLHLSAQRRLGLGRKYDVYELSLKNALSDGAVFKGSSSTFRSVGRKYEYVVHLVT